MKAMPSRHNTSQRGFTLIEVLSASMVLSVFITAIGACWISADRQINGLVLRQKAVFIAGSEMERVSTLYNTSSFGLLGPVTTAGYDGPSYLPTTRLVYPTPVTPYSGGPASDFTTTDSSGFLTGDAFQVYVSNQLLPSLNRAYVWLDQSEGVMARVSWTTTAITPAACVVGSDGCGCLAPSGVFSAQCQRLDLYLEYPYRFVAGVPSADGNLKTVVLSTIVGRHT